RGYEEFLQRVSAGRKKTRDQVDAIAQGRVWAGTDAKRLGLVDQLGSFDDAVRSAARHAKLTDYDLEFVEPELTWAQELVLQLKSSAARTAVKALMDDKSRAFAQVAQKLDPLTKEVTLLSRFTE